MHLCFKRKQNHCADNPAVVGACFQAWSVFYGCVWVAIYAFRTSVMSHSACCTASSDSLLAATSYAPTASADCCEAAQVAERGLACIRCSGVGSGKRRGTGGGRKRARGQAHARAAVWAENEMLSAIGAESRV